MIRINFPCRPLRMILRPSSRATINVTSTQAQGFLFRRPTRAGPVYNSSEKNPAQCIHGSTASSESWCNISMCGRFTQKYTWRELVELYRLTQPARNLQPRYNAAPTTTIDAVRVRDGTRELVPMRWGLVPSWWKKSLTEVPEPLTPAAKPSPRSRCIAPLSNALVALFQRQATTSGERSTVPSSATTSALLMPACFRSPAYGMNGSTSPAASPCSLAQ